MARNSTEHGAFPGSVEPRFVLSVNGGSSSVKFALFRLEAEPVKVFSGAVDRVGTADAALVTGESAEPGAGDRRSVKAGSPAEAGGVLAGIVRDFLRGGGLAAIAHRFVHGGPRFFEAQEITGELADELRGLSPFDPEHLPAELELFNVFSRSFPESLQVACFDTAFHRDMPPVAKLLPIPRRFFEAGVHRYGFHGISYAYLLEELSRVAGGAAARGRVILAHLGSGSSLAAVRDGRCIDTTMGFTPASGIPMGRRSGDLDPGLAWFLASRHGMSAEEFHEMVNRRSGLLGVSDFSSDVRDLLKKEAEGEVRAAEALELYCYHIKKAIGSLAAALGGVETLVFSGGVGENAPAIRERVCRDLGHLGIELDASRNASQEARISSAQSRVEIRVIATGEELMMARAVHRVLDKRGAAS